MLLHKLLPDLVRYLESNPNSRIARFFGIHALKLPVGETVYVAIMDNIFQTDRTIDEAYDIKGSWVNRSNNTTNLGLDQDFQRGISLPDEVKSELLEQFMRDSDFLCRMKIMDYSLLLGMFSSPRRPHSYISRHPRSQQ